jgi:hypothetical protein
MSTIPFSYYLYHRLTGLKYYGIKHANGCNPSDLWTKYFSSSIRVKQLITEYGKDSFDVKIRKTFNSSHDALIWEHKVLRRLNASQNPTWINRHNGGNKFRSPISHTDKTKQLISKKTKGRKFSDDHRKKISEASLTDRKHRKQAGWKMPLTAVDNMLLTRQRKIDSGEINPYSTERNAKMALSKTGKKRKYLPDGTFIMIDPNNL